MYLEQHLKVNHCCNSPYSTKYALMTSITFPKWHVSYTLCMYTPTRCEWAVDKQLCSLQTEETPSLLPSQIANALLLILASFLSTDVGTFFWVCLHLWKKKNFKTTLFRHAFIQLLPFQLLICPFSCIHVRNLIYTHCYYTLYNTFFIALLSSVISLFFLNLQSYIKKMRKTANTTNEVLQK